MPCEILVAARDLNTSKKGYASRIKATPCAWSTVYAPPDWVVIRITNGSVKQMEHILEKWFKRFAYEILQDNPVGYRIKVTVDPSLVSVSGANSELRADMESWVMSEWNASTVSSSLSELVIDIPKVDGVLDLQEVQDSFHDVFFVRVDTRFYYFSSEDVDLAIANGGYLEMTRQQALGQIRNKLDE